MRRTLARAQALEPELEEALPARVAVVTAGGAHDARVAAHQHADVLAGDVLAHGACLLRAVEQQLGDGEQLLALVLGREVERGRGRELGPRAVLDLEASGVP